MQPIILNLTFFHTSTQINLQILHFLLTLETYWLLLVKSCLTQFSTAWNTSSSDDIFNWLFDINSSTSANGSKRNSSVLTTCWKFCSAKQCDFVCSSLHECVSAKLRMPRQLVGWSCSMRNLQHASRTVEIWSRLLAGRRTWTLSGVMMISPV